MYVCTYIQAEDTKYVHTYVLSIRGGFNFRLQKNFEPVTPASRARKWAIRQGDRMFCVKKRPNRGQTNILSNFNLNFYI
jgi:hypothetical protein